MRYRAKTDNNQKEVVAKLRALGASVQSLAPLGGGVPDLLIGHGGRNYLFELKDGRLCPSARKLTEGEATWLNAWRGQAQVATCWEDIAEAVGIFRRKETT